MLRVAITGGPGSGKSTLARIFAMHGAHVISSDELARRLMEPGEVAYVAIVQTFGDGVLHANGTLDRKKLANIAFTEGRVRELEAIVHPAVLAWQSAWVRELAKVDPKGVSMVESALVFESDYSVLHDGDEKKRFDRIILVAASDATKAARFVQRAIAAGTDPSLRSALEADAKRRLALQIPDAEKISRCDFVIENDGNLEQARVQIDKIWAKLETEAAATASN